MNVASSVLTCCDLSWASTCTSFCWVGSGWDSNQPASTKGAKSKAQMKVRMCFMMLWFGVVKNAGAHGENRQSFGLGFSAIGGIRFGIRSLNIASQAKGRIDCAGVRRGRLPFVETAAFAAVDSWMEVE